MNRTVLPRPADRRTRVQVQLLGSQLDPRVDQPPSEAMVWPVTHSASSLHSHARGGRCRALPPASDPLRVDCWGERPRAPDAAVTAASPWARTRGGRPIARPPTTADLCDETRRRRLVLQHNFRPPGGAEVSRL